MSRTDPIPLTCLAAAAFFLSCSGTSGGLLGGPYREPTLVQFSYEAVNPQTVSIPPDGNVTWQNNAPETRGFVVFPASIASVCRDLNPSFVRMESVYRSRPLVDGSSEPVQLPCSLAPGSYDYEIWLIGAGFGSGFDQGRPEKILRAKIVVE